MQLKSKCLVNSIYVFPSQLNIYFARKLYFLKGIFFNVPVFPTSVSIDPKVMPPVYLLGNYNSHKEHNNTI